MKISSLASFCSALDDEELFVLLSAILDRRPELVDLLEAHFEKGAGRAAERRRSTMHNGKAAAAVTNGDAIEDSEAKTTTRPPAAGENAAENPEDEPQFWIHSNKANMIFGFFIIVNSITIGIFTDAPPGAGMGLAIDFFFNSVFIVELGLRVVAEKQNVIWSGWNWLDFILVAFGVVDFAVSVQAYLGPSSDEGSAGMLRMFSILRIVRVLKLVRLLRLFRMFSDLWILCIGLVSALKALVWLFLLLFIFMYVCAIVLTRQVGQPLLVEYDDPTFNCDGKISMSTAAGMALMSQHTPPAAEFDMWCRDRHCKCFVYDNFRSVPQSMFILFQVMTGEDWPTIADSSMKVNGPLMGVFFVIFILFTTFALMNLVTGIIVDKVMSSAKQCQIEMEEQEHHDGKKDLAVLKKTFRMMAHKGSLNVDHFTLGLENPNVVDALKDLDIFLGTDPDTIFNILDMNGSGTLDEQEFCRGALRLKGSTQSRHLLFVQNDLHKHSKNILRMTQEISTKLLQEGKRANHVQETLDQIWHFMRRQASNRWITDPFHSSLHQMISEIYLITRDMNAEAQRKDKEKAEKK
jgi:voltage-gated sodium channel